MVVKKEECNDNVVNFGPQRSLNMGGKQKNILYLL